MEKNLKIGIIGSGISGLTLAVALEKRGFSATIFERAGDIKPAGAGIVLGVNSMKVLTSLDLSSAINNAGQLLSHFKIKNERGRIISSLSLKKDLKDKSITSVGILRSNLHQILNDKIKKVNVLYSKNLKSLSQNNNNVEVVFEDKTEYTFDVLIGADGISSKTHELIMGKPIIRDAGQICFRGICNKSDIDGIIEQDFVETWGGSNRFGYVKTGDNSIYWYMTLLHKENQTLNNNINEKLKLKLLVIFRNWNKQIGRIINATPVESMIRNDLGDREPSDRWFYDKICLLGDAAHPTTPNLGQGAGMGIESAEVLADCLDKYDNIHDVYKKYFELRNKRTSSVTILSWRIGKLSVIKNKFLIRLRNYVMSKTPEFVNKKQMNDLYNFNIYNGSV